MQKSIVAIRPCRLFGAAAVAAGLALAVTLGAGEADAAQAPVNLRTAAAFAVLANSTVTNTGSSVIDGDLGVTPGTAVTGFPPGLVNGTTHTGTDGVGAQAGADETSAYNTAAGASPVDNVATELGGTSPAGGVYASNTLGLTGTLTLHGDASTVWIFKSASTLTTATGGAIVFSGGANACNVFWQIGSSATLGASTAFAGTVLAHDSISVGNAVTVRGRLFAQTGAVTLINDTVTSPDCTTPPPVVPPTTPTHSGKGKGHGGSGSGGGSRHGNAKHGGHHGKTSTTTRTTKGHTRTTTHRSGTTPPVNHPPVNRPPLTTPPLTTTTLSRTGTGLITPLAGGILAVLSGGMLLVVTRRTTTVRLRRRQNVPSPTQ